MVTITDAGHAADVPVVREAKGGRAGVAGSTRMKAPLTQPPP
jgi:hypothetical protein